VIALVTMALLSGAPGAGPLGTLPEVLPEPNVLTVEPLGVVFAKTIALEYERRITHGFSLALSPAIALGDVTKTETNGSYLAFGVTLAARVYPWSAAPEGAFVSPFGGVAYVEADDGAGTSVDGIGWSAGGMVGYTFILGRFFVFSMGAGAAWIDQELHVGAETSGKRGVYPALRLAIGGSF